jgi:DNA-binding NarL/FixJ family response regulator
LRESAAELRARARLRRVGLRAPPRAQQDSVGPQAAARAHPLRLTKRGRKVLDLICAGHANAEIAAHLFISAKTVDHHVSAMLAKLDAPTRNAAASRAARLGLAGTSASR